MSTRNKTESIKHLNGKKTKQNKLIHGAYKDPALLCLLGRLSLVGVGGLEAV